MNCFCWRLPLACGGASFWLSNGMISISRPGRCEWNGRFTEQRGELVISQPKTKAANRTIILPAPLLCVLKEYRRQVHSRWLFPSPRKDDLPLDPASVRKHLTTILERAGCKHIRFHGLRHLFATMSLEHGMDVKTLSTVIGHVSSSTTLNIYAHVTDEMRRTAAMKIDQGGVKSEAQYGESASATKARSQNLPALQG